jgi:hypothetical protein
MYNKFKMELVWHNCMTNPPKEFTNNALIVANGRNVLDMAWHRADGYLVSDDGCMKKLTNLENWWWADIKQTVQGETRFTEQDG